MREEVLSCSPPRLSRCNALVFHPQHLHLSVCLCERVDLHRIKIVDQSRESVICVACYHICSVHVCSLN